MIVKLRYFLTLYLPKTPYIFVYMLQQVEYDGGQFISWANRMPDYRRVMRRKKLVKTKMALILLASSYALTISWIVACVLLVKAFLLPYAALVLAWGPLVTICLLAALCSSGKVLLRAKRKKLLGQASEKMAAHKGLKVAVLGSFGKTTAKEMLATVLAEGKKVAYTPGNMNVDISHARWIMRHVHGDEDVVIFEFGEFRPGDIAAFSRLTHPDMAIVTGYAPNHLDSYKSVDRLKEDLTSIEDYVRPENIFISDQAASELSFNSRDIQTYGSEKVADWRVEKIKTGFDGTKLELHKDRKKLLLHSQVLGSHLAPLIGLTALIAKRVGLTDKQIAEGVARTKPYEHRLQPTAVSGAWIIDDTYNGSIEGMRAGLALLADVPAKRKMYVTPGLVEQGKETETVHTELGELIANAAPDVVVLMRNSVCKYIEHSLLKHGYKNEIRIVDDPLDFYTNLQYELAAGDVVLMQNDWTDNYS